MCFDSCLKGRAGVSFFGCSTKFGINIVSLLSLIEVGIIGYLFINELGDGEFSLKVFTWLGLCFFRLIAFLSMCCDSISKRKYFMWTLLFTTALEIAMFTILNVSLFDGDSSEVAFTLIEAWGMGEAA